MQTSLIEAKEEVFSDGGEERPQKKTEFKPFNLTKPKPKMIPPPDQIKREIKAKPIPKGMFKKTLKDIEDEKAERRKATVNAIKGDYDENVKKRFDLKTEKLTSNKKVQKVKEEVEQSILKELKF